MTIKQDLGRQGYEIVIMTDTQGLVVEGGNRKFIEKNIVGNPVERR